MTKNLVTKAGPDARSGLADPSRRKVLARLGAFAAYTAPVMTTLLIATEARAHHAPGHVIGPVDVCAAPNAPPACGSLPEGPCAGNPSSPVCQVGSLGAGPESAGFDAPYDSYDAPSVGYDDAGDDAGWNSDD